MDIITINNNLILQGNALISYGETDAPPVPETPILPPFPRFPQFSPLRFSADFWDTYSEPLTFSRSDAKNPDQTRPQWEVIGTAQGIIELDDRIGSLESERGLDTQDFIYKVIVETQPLSKSLQNKDRITTEDGTHLHAVFVQELKSTIYTEVTCTNISDPHVYKARRTR